MSEIARSAAGNPASRRAAQSMNPGMLAVGGLVAAIGASSCCVLPLVLFALGISGAWIGNLTALAPYQPIFIGAAAGLLALGYRQAYRRQRTCASDASCAGRPPGLVVKFGLIAATLLVIIAAGFEPLMSLFLPS